MTPAYASTCLALPCLALRERGDQDTFPRKTAKAEGKLRRGAAFVVMREDGALLARTRPDKGLLAGMTEVPTTEWTHDFDEADALKHAPALSSTPLPNPPPTQVGPARLAPDAEQPGQGRVAGGREKKYAWHRVAGAVNHVFTHFPLELVVYRTQAPKNVRAPKGMRWIARQEIDGEAFPNVMRKVIAHAIT